MVSEAVSVQCDRGADSTVYGCAIAPWYSADVRAERCQKSRSSLVTTGTPAAPYRVRSLEGMNTTQHAMAVTGLHHDYGRTAVLRGVTLAVGHGEIVGLLGPNGAGKSTLVSCLVGLLRPTGGHARIGDLDPYRQRSAVRRILGVQLQGAQFHDALTVNEILGLFGAAYADPWPREELMARVGISTKATTRFSALSGGQQQRLALAVAMIGRPRLLVLDELTTGLDPQARTRIWDLVLDLRADGASVLLVSHSMEEVERLCDRAALLMDGRIAAQGAPGQIVSAARENDPAVSTLDDAYLAFTGERIAMEKETDW